MLHKHLQNIKCPNCNSNNNWNLNGASNSNHITDGVISCNNKHTWSIIQEILRMDRENSEEAIIYSEREMTGYPKEVTESERLEFLDFIEEYFQNINFPKDTVVVNGEPILFFRFLNDFDSTFITVKNDEKLLRQLHESIVQKRLHNNHTFIRADTVEVTSVNQLYIFKNINKNDLDNGDILIQFSSVQNEPQGTVLWTGQNYFLEEITG